ncbi:hypothetical protein CHS0354_032627, partial [Potamilus streckersoni]
VIMAGVGYDQSDVVSSGFTNIRRMLLETIFKEGANKLALLESNREFLMFSPRNCSPSLLKMSLYVMYGDTDTGGVFLSNTCAIELYDNGFFNKSGRENLTRILWG